MSPGIRAKLLPSPSVHFPTSTSTKVNGVITVPLDLYKSRQHRKLPNDTPVAHVETVLIGGPVALQLHDIQ